MPPQVFFVSKMFCTAGLVSSKLIAQMYVEEIHFRNCYFKRFWHIWCWWPWPLT